ncbi:MAG: hypothetical protein JRK53_26105 [Deltaproteobacteria bacterium]|nr:hypothetical protein [Deltaproteobacteria bacterium]
MDNLHRKSGISPELLAELHGNIARLRCQKCGETTARSEGRQRCTCGGEPGSPSRNGISCAPSITPERAICLLSWAPAWS